MRKYLYLSIAALCAASLASCSSDDNNEPEGPATGQKSPVYVLNQGNFYNAIEGGLSVIDLENKTVANNVFKSANNRSLGDTPQCGVAYGSKIYVGTSQSNTIEIIDRASYLSYKQIRLSENPQNGTSPYSMVADKGYVFISMYDGYVARLDTLTMTIDKSVAVGANPDQIALHYDKIYVPVSEGMNYPNYGRTACIVNPQTMTVEKKFEVGLNPTQFISCGSHLFVLCKGNYNDVPSTLYEVKEGYDKDNKPVYTAEPICNATLAAAFNGSVAIVDEPFVEGAPKATYRTYDPETETLSDWNINQPDYANAIYFDSLSGNLFIASYVMNGMYPSYDLPGYVNVYDTTGENLLYKADLDAAGPACIFSYKK